MKIEVLHASLEEKPVLANLLELYRHDFSEFDGREVGERGLYGYHYLDHYWTEPGRHPFLVRVDGRLAGFILVSVRVLDDTPIAHISEFFVMRKYRRMGVGEVIAHDLFRRFPGRWRVSQAPGNIPAQRFWHAVIGRFTRGMFTEGHDETTRPGTRSSSSNPQPGTVSGATRVLGPPTGPVARQPLPDPPTGPAAAPPPQATGGRVSPTADNACSYPLGRSRSGDMAETCAKMKSC